MTQVKRFKLIGVLLCCLLITGSSNHLGAIGFWHVLNTKANVLQSYWNSPVHFSDHLEKLPKTSLAILARNQISSAQYMYSLKLIKSSQSETAKPFWLSAINDLTIPERKILAAKLLEQSRWGDLKLLVSKNKLPAGDVLNHLKLQLKTPQSKVSTAFIHNLGFSSLRNISKPNKQCMFNVLTMSDHRSGLYKLTEFINTYNKQPEPRENIFCFSKPVYVAGMLECKSSTSKIAKCDWELSKLNNQLPNNYDFIVMMPKDGTANVTKGTMLINSKAKYSVFLHELMHFNGFEDEYALPKTKQAWLCAKTGFVAPNLFISHGEPPPTDWHKAKSCQQGGIAYKPSENWSIMQYQQLGLSAQYRQLWLKHLDTTNGKFHRHSSALTFANKTILN
ncbi:hypothetical protein H5089_11430 [Pseudoalteromonas sp. SR45-1]|uniref:hypothetical protein n=1 Tax=Pseudoalteromonas sp. SR45-1 TaxID=2760932 RepID=UPI00160117EC|nr:hypothetical protein [Pseudoalteromonas sp. SR45-1]MBB1326097.1 hypothetical protein [Pseudoalteromonas sp. SR45-1]